MLGKQVRRRIWVISAASLGKQHATDSLHTRYAAADRRGRTRRHNAPRPANAPLRGGQPW
ncbi:MAG TPA: hypothetical protein DD670_07270 [Planctomycetaceae bacterium]|nr:hypothetical protein [Planctomycetaceae bacterium]